MVFAEAFAILSLGVLHTINYFGLRDTWIEIIFTKPMQSRCTSL